VRRLKCIAGIQNFVRFLFEWPWSITDNHRILAGRSGAIHFLYATHSLAGEVAWRYSHQKRKLQFLFSPWLMHPHLAVAFVHYVVASTVVFTSLAEFSEIIRCCSRVQLKVY